MDKPLIIGIGGSRSGSGKTTIAVKLLENLSKENTWAAIKYTKTAVYSSIIDTPELISKEDKDTGRLLRAGAKKVLWVQSPSEMLKDILPLAVERLSAHKGIVVEGNSAIEFLGPDIVIFVIGRGSKSLKKSALNVLNMADIVLFFEEPKADLPLPEKAKKIKIAFPLTVELDEFLNYIRRV